MDSKTYTSLPELPNEQIHVKPPQQPFPEVSPYFNHRISTDTKGLISPFLDENSDVYVIVDAFTLHQKMMQQMHSLCYLITGLLNSEYPIFW